MIVSIHQPNYLPWIGYFYKAIMADKFIFLNDVQFTKGDYINRVKIYSPQKQTQWLTVPISVKMGMTIDEVLISEQWQAQHLKTIKQVYCKCKYFEPIFYDIESILLQEKQSLSSLNMAFIRYVLCQFNANTEFYISSELCSKNLVSDDRLIELIKKVNGTEYLSGSGGFKYQSIEKFNQNDIDVLSYKIKTDFVYTTQYQNIIGLSILDFIFNEGFNKEKLMQFGEIVV